MSIQTESIVIGAPFFPGVWLLTKVPYGALSGAVEELELLPADEADLSELLDGDLTFELVPLELGAVEPL